MKKTDKWKKYNRRRFIKIMVAVVAVILFAMPAVATFALMSRSEAADASFEATIKAKDKMDREQAAFEAEQYAQNDTLIAGTTKLDIEPATTEPMPEISTARQGILSASHATVGDASANDAVEEITTEAPAVNETATVSDADIIEETEEEEEVEIIPNGKKVYITFDDGPSSYTNEILDILDEYGVKATFFVVAEDTSEREGMMEIVSRGHTIGLHSRCHEYGQIYADLDSFIGDVQGVHDLVYRMTGVDSKLYRFPGGSATCAGWGGVDMDDCVDYLNDNGYTYFDWNALSGDAVNPDYSVETMLWNVMDGVRSNEGDSIVLLHDQENHYNTVLALPSILETLISEGYEIVPLDQNAPTFQQYINE